VAGGLLAVYGIQKLLEKWVIFPYT
jgi:hypothetical protein